MMGAQMWEPDIRRFLHECCEVGADRTVETVALWLAYEQWARRQGLTVAGRTQAFNLWLRRLGFSIERRGSSARFHGIALRPDA